MDENINKSTEDNFPEEQYSKPGVLFLFLVPVLFTAYLAIGMLTAEGSVKSDDLFSEGENSALSQLSLISTRELASPVKDTVYTNMDCWLELRIHEQMLYQHWRNGKVDKYPISSGNKHLSKSVESRPGLFAIFYKNEHHKSVQFNDASLYHFMTFNQGIGFHSLNGTAYYGYLGSQPSSHGCIRMRHEDAKKIFGDCPKGTLVLAHNGYSARTVGFAPKGVETPVYTKDEYKMMLAKNLKNVLEGKYYSADRKFFVVDPSIIPVSGVYTSYDKHVPKKQKLPVMTYTIKTKKDRVDTYYASNEIQSNSVYSIEEESISQNISKEENINIAGEDLIKKYFHNPIGILPYFPPTQRAPRYSNYTVTSTSSSTSSAPSQNTGTGDLSND